MAAGTIILTGANGSLALHAADYLLKSYPDYHAVFAVRDAADADPNTQRLRDIMALYPESQCSIHQVDHAELSTVHEFAGSLAASVASGELPPLKAIICNASYWNLVSDPELTVDGYEKAIQVSHIAHVALIMRLTGSFSDDGGRIVLFSSISHYRRPNFMTHLLPVVPDGTDGIVHPAPGDQKQAYGMQRYATGKFLITTWMYALNRHLQEVRPRVLATVKRALADLRSRTRRRKTSPLLPSIRGTSETPEPFSPIHLTISRAFSVL